MSGRPGAALAAALLVLLPAVLRAAPVAPVAPVADKEQLARGRQIYREGTSPSGAEIVAVMGEGVEVPAKAVPCAGCHGRDGKGRPEGGVAPSDLTWSALTKPYGVTHPSGRKHPPYDAKTLKRAIALGLDPAGHPLHVAMPRFRMSLQDMADLVAYLQQLGTEADPGVSGTAVRIGVVLPPAGPLGGLAKGVRAALEARFAAVNRDGGVYGRQIEPRFFEAPQPADQRRGWTSDFLEREEVFAVVAPFFAGADSEMAALFAERQVPAVGPFTLHPRESLPLNRYVFYLQPGIEEQARALVRSAAALRPPGPARPSPLAVVAPAAEGSKPAVEAAVKAATAAGWPSPLVLRTGGGSGAAELKRLASAQADPVVFLGSGPEAVAFLRAADALGWRPRLLATAAAADGSLFGAPAAFAGKILLALPSAPGGPEPEAAAAYRALGPLPADGLTAQWSALAAADVLIEGLRRAGRDLDREHLIDQLETLRGFSTGFAPPVTYAATRRLGARGAWVARLDLQAKKLVPQGGWVEVE